MAQSWNISMAEKMANQSLQDRANTWHYFPTKPPTHLTMWVIEVEYSRNQLLDHIQVLNSRLDDQTLSYKYFK